MVLGWLLTILAVSLGAPFWFDMLNRVISIRTAGRAPEEKPKSPEKVPLPREAGNVPVTDKPLVIELRGASVGGNGGPGAPTTVTGVPVAGS